MTDEKVQAYEQYKSEAQIRAEITAELAEEFRDKVSAARSEGYDCARQNYDKTKARWRWFWRSMLVLAVSFAVSVLIWAIADGVGKSNLKDQAIKDWQMQCITDGGVLYKQTGAVSNTDLTYCVVGKVVSTR